MKRGLSIDFTRLWGSMYHDFLLRSMKRFLVYFSREEVIDIDAPRNYSYGEVLAYYADHFGVKPIDVERRFDRLYLRTPVLARHKVSNKPVLLLPKIGSDYQIIDDNDHLQSVISVKDIAKNFDNLVQLFPLNAENKRVKLVKTASQLFYPSFAIFMLAIVFVVLVLAFFTASSLIIDVSSGNRFVLSLAQIFSALYLMMCLMLVSMVATQNYGLLVVFFCHDLFCSLSAFINMDEFSKKYYSFEERAQLIFFDGYKLIFALVLFISLAIVSFIVLPAYVSLAIVFVNVILVVIASSYSLLVQSKKQQKLSAYISVRDMLMRIRDTLAMSSGLGVLDSSIYRLQKSQKKFTRSSFEHWYINRLAHFSYFLFPLISVVVITLTINDNGPIGLWQVGLTSMMAMSSGFVAAYIGLMMFEFRDENKEPISLDNNQPTSRRVQLVRMKGTLELAHISFAYEKTGQVIFKDFCLTLNEGQIYGVEGPSGSGKTTLLKIMMGFLTPQNGRVIYDGHDIKSLDLNSLRENFGVIFDRSLVFSGSVYENIVCGRLFAPTLVKNLLLSHEIFDGLIDMPMGLSTYIMDNGKNISSYQKFLILFARALVHKPKYIFIDEVMSTLSLNDQKRVMEYLANLEATCVITSPRKIDCQEHICVNAIELLGH